MFLGSACPTKLGCVEADDDFQAMGGAVAAGDGAATGFDAGSYDSQAEAGASGFASARGFGTVEGREDFFQFRFGESGAAVSDGDRHLIFADGGTDGYGTGRSGIASGVAEDVGESALQEGFVRRD